MALRVGEKAPITEIISKVVDGGVRKEISYSESEASHLTHTFRILQASAPKRAGEIHSSHWSHSSGWSASSI